MLDPLLQTVVPYRTLQELKEVKYNCQLASYLHCWFVMCIKIESNSHWLPYHILDKETEVLLDEGLPDLVNEILVISAMNIWLQPLLQVCFLIEALCDHAATGANTNSHCSHKADTVNSLVASTFTGHDPPCLPRYAFIFPILCFNFSAQILSEAFVYQVY